MIAHLRGRLVQATAGSVVVDVGGVGYRASVSAHTRGRLPPVGHEVLLHTSLQVREDSLALYAFADLEELELFEALLGVAGVGPKVALAILSATTPAEFRRAVVQEDVAALTRLPQVGKKTAQRLVLELRDRLGARGAAGAPAPAAPAAGGEAAAAAPPAAPDPWSDALEALVALGYTRAEAAEALDHVRREAPAGAGAPEVVRLALRWLGARKAR